MTFEVEAKAKSRIGTSLGANPRIAFTIYRQTRIASSDGERTMSIGRTNQRKWMHTVR